MKLPSSVIKLSQILMEIGARPIVVGGYVRDHFLGVESKDIDIEVYGISSLDVLKSSLETFTPVHEVGKSFGVLKIRLDDHDLDISLPRTEIKTAKGHKGFHVQTNGYLDFNTASKRRDFTMNAIGYDIKTDFFIDPHGGKVDIKNSIIRHVDDKSFAEDPLRVLRAVQFAARFNFKLDTNTLKLCQTMIKDDMLSELPKERIFEEYKKLLLKAPKPSIGFELLDKLNALFPELKALQGIVQDETKHPEGDVWTHTMMSLDAMAELKTGNKKKDITLMLAILCHDLGKVKTTKIIDNEVSATDHHNVLEPALSLLERLSDQKSLVDAVIALIQEHPMPSRLYKEDAQDSDIRRLSTRIDIEDLVTLAKADNFGRSTQDAMDKKYPPGEWLLAKAKELNILHKGPEQILQGRHLIACGQKAGKQFKDILQQSYEAQLEGRFFTEEEALVWLEDYLSSSV